jgi:hypothetical protein
VRLIIDEREPKDHPWLPYLYGGLTARYPRVSFGSACLLYVEFHPCVCPSYIRLDTSLARASLWSGSFLSWWRNRESLERLQLRVRDENSFKFKIQHLPCGGKQKASRDVGARDLFLSRQYLSSGPEKKSPRP